MACWVAFKDNRSNGELPFKSSAIQDKERTFETVDDIWDELLWFVNKKIPELEGNISTGQYLWLEQFYDSSYIIENWMFELITMVNTCMSANIPISSDLLSCPVMLADYFPIIKEELNSIGNF